MNEKSLLVALMALLERENTVSIPQLARLLDTTEKEIWDALEVLVFCYDSVSVRLDLHSAYASLEKTGTDRLLRLTREETGILIDALEAQGFSADDELCAKLIQTKGFLEGAASGGAESEHPPQASVQTVASGSTGGIAERLAAACDDPQRHLLAIQYQKEGAGDLEERVVEPRALVSKDDRLYLRAFCRTAGGWRSFRADRIKSATPLAKTYEPRAGEPDWNSEMHEDSTPAHVRISAGAELPSWPGLGHTSANADGSHDVEVPWLGGMWLPKHIVALQGAAVPLDPPELVEKTRACARSLLS